MIEVIRTSKEASEKVREFMNRTGMPTRSSVYNRVVESGICLDEDVRMFLVEACRIYEEYLNAIDVEYDDYETDTKITTMIQQLFYLQMLFAEGEPW
ncbi:MAG: hypothetical protein IKE74_05480 [Mogibacterium sp.]|nr:hypothetical protein [Mogibacterium sp.]